MENKLKKYPHRRFNALSGEWVLVSPHRWERPWQGKIETVSDAPRRDYEPDCYLCPGNLRANGERNPGYTDTFVFTNDFSALMPEPETGFIFEDNLFIASTEKGICRVVCFSSDHSLTLAQMKVPDIEKVVKEWIYEFNSLSKNDFINYILIFENKGELMGNSNPHPHCQIWAQENLPSEVQKESMSQRLYLEQEGKCLLCTYLDSETKKDERIVFENEDFAVLVPFWAVWPYETIIISKRHFRNIDELSGREIKNFSSILNKLTSRYDKLFNTSFPYSSGIHQAPVDGKIYNEWHFHMHFYPPLLRSATIKKYMVGYELLGNPQRDLTPESAAVNLRVIQ
jgi:UDPglucose--hexose-1-phosphate uridylyltransferase